METRNSEEVCSEIKKKRSKDKTWPLNFCHEPSPPTIELPLRDGLWVLRPEEGTMPPPPSSGHWVQVIQSSFHEKSYVALFPCAYSTLQFLSCFHIISHSWAHWILLLATLEDKQSRNETLHFKGEKTSQRRSKEVTQLSQEQGPEENLDLLAHSTMFFY